VQLLSVYIRRRSGTTIGCGTSLAVAFGDDFGTKTTQAATHSEGHTQVLSSKQSAHIPGPRAWPKQGWIHCAAPGTRSATCLVRKPRASATCTPNQQRYTHGRPVSITKPTWLTLVIFVSAPPTRSSHTHTAPCTALVPLTSPPPRCGCNRRGHLASLPLPLLDLQRGGGPAQALSEPSAPVVHAPDVPLFYTKRTNPTA
jgi:hypothetical protein